MSKIRVFFDGGVEHEFNNVLNIKKEKNFLFLIQKENDSPTITINIKKVLFIEEIFNED